MSSNTSTPASELDKLLDDLQTIETRLGDCATSMSTRSTIVKAFVIILGVIVTTKITFNLPYVDIIAGALITILTGLETLFKWSTRSGRLAALAVTCRDTRQRIKLDKIIATTTATTTAADKENTLIKLSETLIAKLQQVENEAISFGEGDKVTRLKDNTESEQKAPTTGNTESG